MFVRLFLKECKQILKCTTYYVLIICMVLFYSAQLGDFKMIEKPRPGQEDYGLTYSKDENVIMSNAVQKMVLEFTQNNYVTYPIGFYKTVKLNEDDQLKMSSIVAEVTGLTKEEVIEQVNYYLNNVTPTSGQISMSVDPSITYSHFQELMNQADKLLGGGSGYSKTFMLSNSITSMTYEEALAEYNNILDKDHLSGAYARLFCDYLGIILAILPVFLAVTRGVRDKRARVSQVIYVRRANSATIILSRYLSMIVMVLIPVIILAAVLGVQCSYNGLNAGISVDNLAFAKYTFGWLLPSILISTAVGVFVTELTESAIGILIMGAWWFTSLFMGVIKINGGYGWNLMPRHNSLGDYQIFHDNFGLLVANRITYSVAAFILIAAAVFIYERKRKGKLIIHGTMFSNRKSKSQV